MELKTSLGKIGVVVIMEFKIYIPEEVIIKYFNKLIGKYYQLLPVFEGRSFYSKEIVYTPEEAYKQFKDNLNNLSYELHGLHFMFTNNELFISLLSLFNTIQSIQIDEHDKLRNIVFSCINICNKLKEGEFKNDT